MKINVHESKTRGHANHGWLDTHHTFSFAQYYNPERIQFGKLRVLNDDIVAGGNGFGAHPHDNMEIISIPLEGDLEHRDSMGTKSVIKTNEVQVMSAGSGIVHSEYNASSSERVNFLQIWIMPKLRNIAPRYDQKTIQLEEQKNEIVRVISPMEDSHDSLKINQDAYMSMTLLEKGKSINYEMQGANNGLYVFVISGSADFSGQILGMRDGAEFTELSDLTIEAKENSRVLLIEIPMD